MSRKKNARTREAIKRRRVLPNGLMHIPSPSLRTLKPSARKELEQERTLQLQISPWVRDPAWRLETRVYPPATLLGLPAELRQQVLYEICNISSLEADYRKLGYSVEARSFTRKRNTIFSQPTVMPKLRASGWGRYAQGLIKVLCRQIGTLCCVAPLVRLDMGYVSKRWENELEQYMERRLGIMRDKPVPELPAAAEGCERLFDDTTNAWTLKQRHGKEIVVKSRKVPGKRLRAHRCWYCMERHLEADPICPPARRNEAKWQNITRKVGGRRGSAESEPTFKGKKVVFNDE